MSFLRFYPQTSTFEFTPDKHFKNTFFRCLVLLDVEGLSCAKKQDDCYDLKLFTLALLSSSVLIYNTKGTIEASSLDTLHLASKIGAEFMKDSSDKNISEFFPILVWAIRDHFLTLVVNGKSASPKEHMEDILNNEKKGAATFVRTMFVRKIFKLYNFFVYAFIISNFLIERTSI